jgi:hypothetical protein
VERRCTGLVTADRPASPSLSVPSAEDRDFVPLTQSVGQVAIWFRVEEKIGSRM